MLKSIILLIVFKFNQMKQPDDNLTLDVTFHGFLSSGSLKFLIGKNCPF